MSTAERSTPPLEPRPLDVDEDDLLTVPDHLVTGFLVTNPALVRKLKAEREQSPSAFRDEVWEGGLCHVPGGQLRASDIRREADRRIRHDRGPHGRRDGPAGGCNVSDRIEGWRANYREPDVAVYLPGNPAIIRRRARPAAVPILGLRSSARATWPARSSTSTPRSTRGSLLIDRHPWALELYRLDAGRFDLVGTSIPDKPDVPDERAVLPLTFRLVGGEGRPTIELARVDGGRVR